MDKPKGKLVKSKSSNSAITTKSDNKENKKCKSNAEFQPHVLKKRGVYVEKKSTRITSPSNEKPLLRAPPRPRAGKKRFLASVFTILSKSTAYTQYPEAEDNTQKKERKQKTKKKKETVEENQQTTPKRKQKYRSKYLDEFRKENQQLVILQSKKDLIHTPSNYSSCLEQESIKRLNLPRLVKAEISSDESTKTLKSKLYENIPIAKEIIEGKKLKEKKVSLLEKESNSLVANTKDNGLYNFFVDLLETTFSVYNVKAQFDSVPVNSDMSESKVEFEIDENVAKKLNVTNSPCPSPEMFDDVTQKPSGNYFYITPDNFWADKKPDENFNPPEWNKYSKRVFEFPANSSFSKNKKPKANSFVYNKPAPPVTETIVSPKKSILRKNRKKDLMGLLKQQLQMDDDVYEEPQNFYQALRVIARNKRRLKEITFNEPKRKTTNNIIEYHNSECMFKRRSLISPRQKSKKYRPKSEFIQSMRAIAREYSSDLSTQNRTRLIKPESVVEYNESNHSVEVYGYDYENSWSKKPLSQPQKEIVFTYHTSSSESGDDFNPEEAILNYYGGSQGNFQRA